MGWYDSGASSLAGMAQIAQNYKAEPNAGASIASGIDTAVQKIKSRAEEVRLNDLRVASENRVKDLLAQPPKAGENPTQWLSQVAEAGSYLDPQKKAALDQTIKGYTMQYETDTKKLLQQEGFAHSEKMQQEQIASAEKLAEERNKLTEKQIGVSALIANTQANSAAQDLALKQANAKQQGLFYDEKTKSYKQDLESPEYKQAKFTSDVSEFEKLLGTPIDATKAGEIAKVTPSLFSRDAKIAEDALNMDRRISSFANRDTVALLTKIPEGRRLLQNLVSVKGTANIDDGNKYLGELEQLLGKIR